MDNRRLDNQIIIDCNKNEVSTKNGILRGVWSKGIYSFYGIKYAVADRFKMPRDVEPWEGVKEAIAYGNACPELSTPVPEGACKEQPVYTVQSEDCHYLNIFTKECSEKALRPVRVFFMDKDFSVGYSVEKLRYDIPEEVLISNTVIVTVNTRLNILGYLDISEYAQGYEHSGCLGLADREFALKWIKENISAFGGNPEFIKVYCSEGADLSGFVERTVEESHRMTEIFFEALNVEKEDIKRFIEEDIHKIRYDVLADAAIEAQEIAGCEFKKKITFSPVADDVYCKGHPLVSTPNGVLRGEKKDSTYIFRGIKYADAERFRAPRPVKPWTGVKDALAYGAVCPEIETVQPNDSFTVPHVFYPQHEDCQYLNIWTGSLNAHGKAPVMVWLHGGGFATGSGIEHFAYNGKDLCEFGDVVVVTLNHRLNALGYLDLSKYGPEYEFSKNAGNLDIVEALKWIAANISCFGGDPGNVTIFGQSGGGAKVASLLQMPVADGLFHRAIIQSGLAKFFDRNASKPDYAGLLLEKLGIAPENVNELDTRPFYEIAGALLEIDSRAPFTFGPVRDDKVYLGDAFEVGICEHAQHIPVMVGNVLGEFCNNFVFAIDDGRKNEWDEAKSIGLINEAMGDMAADAIALQRQAYPDKPVGNVLFTDRMFRASTFDYLHLRAKLADNNTYGYMFAAEMPVYGGTLPWHNAEIPYVFHNAHCIEPSYIKGVTEKLEDVVSGAFVNFARTGNPGFAPYTEDNHSMMYFDIDSCAKNADSEERLARLTDGVTVKLKPCVREMSPHLYGGGPRV